MVFYLIYSIKAHKLIS